MDYSPPGSSVHGISQARILEWVAFPSPGDLPDPGIKHKSSALAGRFFTVHPPGKPLNSSRRTQRYTVLYLPLGVARTLLYCCTIFSWGFPGGSVVRFTYQTGAGLIPGSERFPEEGNSSPLQDPCLGNPMDIQKSLVGYSPWDYKELYPK